MNLNAIPECWREMLKDQIASPNFRELQRFVTRERTASQVFPPSDDVFAALTMTPLNRVRVLILGQDPYHDDGQAHGLSFSVRHGIRIPPSLRNIYKELESDLQIPAATHGCLEAWAHQGVLLLNTVLTVRAHEPNSHRKHGWEDFTTRVIECVNELPSVAFVLWGKPAQKKASLIHKRHLLIRSPHPSPLSARRGFFGSRPFSQTNTFLESVAQPPIDWRVGERPPQ
ncbi:MAG: uracil-DNA glycosylase [Fuerstiella sp.]|jgi:uracil-DNA glycosylase|nr:uracil-DNA glycosylase [Fuerstiella sp.]MCP4511347.1 uracil-DNA glycosylase [Fuerstiella sp.]MDG2130110.1 uracil-DNA glycosylase [Fuerstiella sp.]